MKLYIDTSNREKIIVGIDGKRFETKAKEGASQRLLSFIEEVLASQGVPLERVDEVEVNPGPGSFTGLRVGVSVANALAWALGIKMRPVDIKY